MRVAVLNRPGEVAVVERPAPVPGPDEVLVRVRAVGVCGSDTHYFDHGRIGRFVVESPLVLGHEASGVVERVGSGVDPTRVGERVSIEPGVPCRQCGQCLAGRYNLCPDMVFHATPPVDGSLAELVVIHQAFAHPVPDSVGDEEAALLEPLSVGIWACRKGRVGPGSRVLVIGAGPIGLVCVQVARACGAREVVVSDVNAQRLSVGTDLGANDTFRPGPVALPDWYAGRPGSPGAPRVHGAPGATVEATRALAPAAGRVLFGLGGNKFPCPFSPVRNPNWW